MNARAFAVTLPAYGRRHCAQALAAIIALYCVLALRVASVNLDIDEFTFVREPYEMLGGDYTVRYLKSGEYRAALGVAARAYVFYWKYRPLNAPVVSERDRGLFSAEEQRFGYQPPKRRIPKDDPNAASEYKQRLVVPEPDRMYTHGAGKPLLPALLTAPQLGITAFALHSPKRLMELQFSRGYHPAFVLVRLVQLLAGIATVLLCYWVLRGFASLNVALVGAALVAWNPWSITYFPNIHHDSVMVPFLVLCAGLLLRRKLVWGAIAFGLALASKNAAVLVVPALLYLLCSRVIWAATEQGEPHRRRAVAIRIAGFAAVAVLAMAPFASPVSYAKELLTPVIGREFDTRGEDVASYELWREGPQVGEKPGYSTVRPELKLIWAVTGMDLMMWLPAVLGLCLVAREMRGPGPVWAWITLLTLVPAGAVFNDAMTHRVLMFLPPFAVLTAVLLPRRWTWTLAFALLAVSVVYALDPMTVHTSHTPPLG